ncbi:bifunctional nuclease family protein [Pseudactinotalea sp. Z1748]|uniref:bifunctional nuclease family protein n=1 Tax=Pseudactinotalea sp. Z1748 TaxID=3413027 RepID=UPI003C7D0907
MGVTGVRVRMQAPEQDVLVLLGEAEGERSLPIVIGPHEGVAIATAHAGMQPPRPGPHDLMVSVLTSCGVALTQVNIVELRAGTFIAELVLSNGARVDSRASDAIALALRAQVDVWCAEDVLDEAAVVLETDTDGNMRVSEPVGIDEAEAEVAHFREFLDSVAAEDFADPREE